MKWWGFFTLVCELCRLFCFLLSPTVFAVMQQLSLVFYGFLWFPWWYYSLGYPPYNIFIFYLFLFSVSTWQLFLHRHPVLTRLADYSLKQLKWNRLHKWRKYYGQLFLQRPNLIKHYLGKSDCSHTRFWTPRLWREKVLP